MLPEAIPFADLKRKDLEECVFWLMDAMGAKDLEWRLGGTGASDGGRDLEAQFYASGADGEIESQRWWIECKGRKGTVEPDEVKSAVNNALAKEGLDYLVVATEMPVPSHVPPDLSGVPVPPVTCTALVPLPGRNFAGPRASTFSARLVLRRINEPAASNEESALLIFAAAHNSKYMH